MDNTLQSVLVLSSCSSVPDGDGGGEDGFSDDGLQVRHQWQVEHLQLLQEVNPLLNLELEVLTDGQEIEGLHIVTGGAHRVMEMGGAVFLLKSTTISTIFITLRSKLFCSHQVTRCSILASSPSGALNQ